MPALWWALACNTRAPKPEVSTEIAPRTSARPAGSASESRANSYGAAISPGAEAELARVLEKPRDYAGKTVTVEGEVRKVCKKMGCWMELSTEKSESAPGCRVFFGAHQFFIPTDSDGARAKVQGEVEVRKVEADFVKHLEEEGASFKAKNPDGSADEVRLVATGVELDRS